MNTDYIRVVPRDLFNEAKLLKCIGHLVLQIHDNNNVANISFHHDDEPFIIGLLDEGYLQVCNISFWVNNIKIDFVSQYNSKGNYPLMAYHDYCEYVVFNDDGTFCVDFLDFASRL